jgi:hypothetical protein
MLPTNEELVEMSMESGQDALMLSILKLQDKIYAEDKRYIAAKNLYGKIVSTPMSLSLDVKATKDGVVRLPWSFAMISTRSFIHVPTAL